MSDLIGKVTAAYERDQRQKAVPVIATDLPTSFESITPAWLTAVLCRDVPQAEVVDHQLGPVDNGSSNRRKIEVRYNEAGAAAGRPPALFCKAAHGLANRVILGLSGAAEAEAIFYTHIRHLLPLNAPVGYHAHFDPESMNSIIILGDISQSVTEFCTHTTLMDRGRAESQMHLLGVLHGFGYANVPVRAAAGKLGTSLDYFKRTKLFGLDHGACQGFIEAGDVIPERLYRRASEIWPATERCAERADRRAPTLTHGDVHLKNWYVAGNGEMGLADWQCCTTGHWARDVAYTISTALTVENRRAWEKDLLALYLDRLATHGGPHVSFDDAWTMYREQLFGALAWWTVTLSPPPGMPDMQPRDTTLEFIRRISTAMDDLDSFGAVAA
jgi:hypothetical protein